jgi:hypothetical protein
MATTAQIPATKAAKKIPMTSTRKTALVAGVFYLITFISIPTLALYRPVLNHRDWIISSGGHTGVLVGGLLEVIVALAGIGTAVTLYPVVKRQNEGLALGFVTSRVVEGVMIFTGVVSLLSLVTVHQDLGAAAGASAASLVATGASHVAVYHWTFLLSQSLMPGINAILLGVFTGRMADREGLQAFPHHRRNRRGQRAACSSGRLRLTIRDTAGPSMGGPGRGVRGRAHRTRRTGRIAAAPTMAHSPATI